MINGINLNWLRTFEAAARHLSFTAASRELGLTQTAVSQHIKALEQKLGQQLFVRRAKSLELTEIGLAYLPSVREGLNVIIHTTSGLFGPDLTSTVVIRASMACVIWLSSQMDQFQDQHPNIGIKFFTAIWPLPVGTHPVDIDIVLAPQKHAGPHLQKLSDEMIVPVCGFQTAKSMSDVSDLTQQNPIHILGFDDHWMRYLAAFDLPKTHKPTRLIVDTSTAACELAAAERGCAIIIERFAKQAISTGQALQIIGTPIPLSQSHYISRRDTDQKQSTATVAVVNWLQDLFKD